MIIVVKPVLPVVPHIDVGPAVVVVVGNAHAVAPTVVCHASLGSHIGEGSIMIVVKQRGVRRRFLAIQRIECGTVHQVDVEPAVVVIIDQANARSVGFEDELLLRHAHLVDPA